MEKDKLKDFIDQNKEDFDLFEPSDQIWEGVEMDLRKERFTFPSKVILRIAASVFFLLGAAWLWMQMNPTAGPEIVEKSTEEKVEYAFTGLSAELEEVEFYYVSEVNFAQEQLNDYEVDEELFGEVEALKLEFELLKEEMGQSADPMMVIEAMIQNYQLRLELLKSILKQVEKERNHQKRMNDERIA